MTAKVYPIQNSFSAGHLSWKLRGRIDTDVYAQGLYDLHNMISDPRGPAYSRGGFEFFREIVNTADAALFAFPCANDDDVAHCILLYDQKLVIWKLDDSYYNEVSAPWLESEIHEVQAKMVPSGNEMYLVHNNHAPQKLVYTPGGPTWSLSAITFTAAPGHWGAGNYPGTVTFFQGRSWWGNTPDNPTRFNSSKSGNYTNMTTGTLADDAIEYDMDNFGLIKWIHGSKNLLIGTVNGEYIVTSEAKPIKPGDIDVDQQSAYGSKNIQPENMGVETLYTSGDGRKIRSMWYRWTESGWVSQDLAFQIDDNTSPIDETTISSIKDLSYARNPDSIIWAVRDDGSLSGCTYFKESSDRPVVGWHDHHLKDGLVMDIVAIDCSGTSKVIAAIHREVNGIDYIHLEKMDDDVYLDGFMKIDNGGIPSISISGAAHLVGKTVSVIADGAIHPDIDIDAGGAGTLDYAADVVYIGHAFHQRFKTLPPKIQGTSGSNASWSKRWNKLFIELYESGMPTINGIRPPERSFEGDMDTPESLITAAVQASDEGYDKDGIVTVEQDLPLPLKITSIFGELSQGQL